MSKNDPEPGEIDEHGFCQYCKHEAPECTCSYIIGPGAIGKREEE